MKIKEVTDFIEQNFPPSLQENYDNCGMQTGNKEDVFLKALITLDVTEKVIEECVAKKCNLIISHHPLIFHGLKRICNSNSTERMIATAIKNDINIYSVHTSIDNSINGFNKALAEKLGLTKIKILAPRQGMLKKLVTFCPVEHVERLRLALFQAGAGNIGNYDFCSFNSQGTGSFRANEHCNPFVGEKHKIHYEEEIRIETIFPYNIENDVLKALLSHHPYEEVAYDVYPLENKYQFAGSGIYGILEKPQQISQVLETLKDILKCHLIKYSMPSEKEISKIAYCGGSGSFLIPQAIEESCDLLITSEVKYHDFFNEKIAIADAGHYETEVFFKEFMHQLLMKKFPTFAFLFSESLTNPVYYL